MRLIVGCPVANRAWSLPLWFECLAAQTRRPDGFAFVHSGQVNDETWRAIQREAARHDFHTVAIHHDESPPHPRHDNDRYRTLARLRNKMLAIAGESGLDADLLLSLDTDVMLEDTRTIERLQNMLLADECDLASPVTFLHPAASAPGVNIDFCWAYNAGWWLPDGKLGDPQRGWSRPNPESIRWGHWMHIDVPMAVWMATKRVINRCRYEWHESGEDLGFAQSLEREHMRCIWNTHLRCRHIWSEQDLRAQALHNAVNA